jgi:hypothetical protein
MAFQPFSDACDSAFISVTAFRRPLNLNDTGLCLPLIRLPAPSPRSYGEKETRGTAGGPISLRPACGEKVPAGG